MTDIATMNFVNREVVRSHLARDGSVVLFLCQHTKDSNVSLSCQQECLGYHNRWFMSFLDDSDVIKEPNHISQGKGLMRVSCSHCKTGQNISIQISSKV